MRSPRWSAGALLLAGCLAAGVGVAQEDPCSFSWNVAHERALFEGSPTALSAADAATTAPSLLPERLYELKLLQQTAVRFAAPPAKSRPGDGPYAGIVQLRVSQAGVYRISLDQASWIDVLDHGQMIASGDFQGRSGCHTPHKVVQFSLPAQSELLIQLSGAPNQQLRLTVTAADSTSAK